MKCSEQSILQQNEVFPKLNEDELTLLIDGLTGRIAYFRRYAGAGSHSFNELKGIIALRSRLERLKGKLK